MAGAPMNTASVARRGRVAGTVTCTGIVTVDHVFHVDAMPTGDGKVSARRHREVGGGVAANAAAAVAVLGGRARFVGAVGDDRAGDDATRGLAELGIDVDGVQTVPGRTTPVSAVIVDRAGGRMVVNHTDPALFASADPTPAGGIGDADAVLCDCRWMAGTAATLRAARERGVPAVVDVDRPLAGDAATLALATHLVVSHEALWSTADTDRLEPALRRLRDRFGGWVAVTLGADGVAWLDRDGVGRMPAHDVTAVDTLGAGDVFHGAFALALAEGRDERSGLRFANAAAALTCTRPDGRAGIPNREEVERLMRAAELASW